MTIRFLVGAWRLLAGDGLIISSHASYEEARQAALALMQTN